MTETLRRRPCPAGNLARLATVAIALVSLSGCGPDQARSDAGAGTNSEGIAAITHVMNRVERSYVVPVKQQKLVDNALKGMLSGLDPHSDYLTRAEFTQMKSDMDGKFGGLGMEITQQEGIPKVLAPIDGTPAARAGIDPGDLIVDINGKPTSGMDLQDVVAKLRGPAGTKVTLAIKRVSRPPFDVTLTRAIIDVPSVKSALKADKIGYARISEFTDNTEPEFSQAIAKLRQEAGGHLNGFVLDLRDDPGGELDAAVGVAGDLLDGQTIVTTRSRQPGHEHSYAAPAQGNLLPGVPIVVLINGASASAAEIVTAALQDNHRATVMGTPSFGKGSVQSVVPLNSDVGGALVLTTAFYFTPSGRSIQGVGVQPNIVVPVPKDEQVANAVTREADFFDAFKNPGLLNQKGAASSKAAPPRAETPALDHPIKPTLIDTAKDAQLNAAINYLKSGALRAGGKAAPNRL